MAENEIITPKENLKANTVADTRAIAAKRGAINAERQAMQTERTLQRKYRRAVRNDDFGGAADISKLLAQTGGSTVGPVIRQAEEERAVAGQRAIDRADQQNKIRAGGTAALMPGDQRPVEPDPANPPPVNAGNQQGADEVAEQATANPEAKAGAGNGRATKGDATALKGSQPAAKGGGSRTVGDRNEAPDAIEAQGGAIGPAITPVQQQGLDKKRGDDLAKLGNDLRRSNLFNDGDPGAIERAVARGGELGMSRDEVMAVKRDKPPLIADPYGEEPSGVPAEKPAPKNTLKEIDDIFASLKPSAPSRYGPKGDILQTPDFKKEEVTKTGSPGKSGDSIFQKPEIGSTAYWSVDPSEIASMKKMVGEGSGAYLAADTSDPRFPVMKIIQDSEDMMKSARSAREVKRRAYKALGEIGFVSKDEFYSDKEAQKVHQELVDHEVIWRAAKEGVDLTEYARVRGPQFFNDYQEAKDVQAEIKKDGFHAEELKSKVNNLLAP